MMISGTIPPGQVLVINGWLQPRLCSNIKMELAFSWWQPSELAFVDGAGHQQTRLSTLRTSFTAGEGWMVSELRCRLRRLEHRLEREFGLLPERLEPWQAVRYRRGDHFDEHHDAGMFASSREGERTVSLLLYLDDHERGGATIFPALAHRIRPAAGTLVLWRNLLKDCTPDPRMRHAGLPPRRSKTVLTTWARERTFRSPSNRRRQSHAKSQP